MIALPSSLRRFIGQTIAPYRWRVAYVLFCPVFMAIENIVMPYALKLLVDGLQTIESTPGKAWALARYPVGLYMAVLVIMMLAFRAREWILKSLQPQIMADMRLRLFDHVSQHSQRYFADHFAGAIGTKISDVARAINALRDFICWRVVPFATMNLLATVMVARIHWALAAGMLGWTVAHLTLSYYLGRRVDASSATNAEDRSQLSGAIVDSISNISVARVFARRAHERRVIAGYQDRECASLSRSLFDIFLTRAITDLLMIALYLGLFVGLIHGWQQGILTLGDMVFVMFTTFFVVEYTWLMAAELPQAFFELGTARQGYATLAVPHEITDAAGAVALQVARGDIAYENVLFRYRSQKPLFEDLSLTIPAGQKIGLVGFSGSGKTTFAHLLLRLYDIDGGAIRIDGQDIATVTQDSLREQIAFIPQDTSLFHRSLMDNIRYGRLDASDAEIIAAAEKADAHGFISALPQGYETLVGERGVKLSGGQRQRIAIARAFLKNAPILILDEATSALDSMTEEAVQQALATLMEGRTTIVIAHRLSTLARMQRILVFARGRIVEEGSHDALLAQGGHYARMWQKQAGGFLPD
jgi:ATP-binding cassette subfamily B protein